ncbi:hypothetical protein C9412_06975 [Stenotrophomonas sp. Nf1]|nr:hypothetical protein C9412_06975 [Stenotrophomonas sp. Nf1]PTA79844.1 hypothetical protein C9416_10540 [Stenotrophomonas sp. Nf4]
MRVRWVKADVAWTRGLRAVPAADMWMRTAKDPNLAAADLEHFFDERGLPRYEFVEHGVLRPWGLQMNRQRSAIGIAGRQAKLLWCFMQPRTMAAAIAAEYVDPMLCRHIPFGGEI